MITGVNNHAQRTLLSTQNTIIIHSHIDLTYTLVPQAEFNGTQITQIYAENDFTQMGEIKFALISAISVKKST